MKKGDETYKEGKLRRDSLESSDFTSDHTVSFRSHEGFWSCFSWVECNKASVKQTYSQLRGKGTFLIFLQRLSSRWPNQKYTNVGIALSRNLWVVTTYTSHLFLKNDHLIRSTPQKLTKMTVVVSAWKSMDHCQPKKQLFDLGGD